MKAYQLLALVTPGITQSDLIYRSLSEGFGICETHDALSLCLHYGYIDINPSGLVILPTNGVN